MVSKNSMLNKLKIAVENKIGEKIESIYSKDINFFTQEINFEIIKLLEKLREFVISEFGKDEIIAYYENYHLNKKGLCFCAQLMYRNKIIDKENLKILMKFLALNKPELDQFNREWGWYPGLYHERIKWLEYQIKQLKAVV